MPRVTIDGQSFEVAEGRNLLETCLSLGFDLPYFCWHPALGSVGACRQCAVKQFGNDGEGKIVMSCMTPASDGARISIADEEARGFRESVIEWLMLNHPHDCPICDEGGECHLQDMTVMTGHDVRRTRFPKRTFRNQDLGPFVHHEMNRCIECYRCVRFYREHAGGQDLGAFAAHDHVYFGRARDGALQSEFSGNLVEVCPTGVFTDKTLKRHYVRKWDLQTAPSVCVHCGLGCNVTLGERYGKLRRVRNRFHRSVNGYFLCDRGRFGYEFSDSERRRRRASLRGSSGEAQPVGGEVALEALEEMLAPDAFVLGIGSPRASVESNYLLRRLVGAERFFVGLGRGDKALVDRALDLLRRSDVASLRDIEAADAALVLGEDVTQFAPRAALALRQIHRNFAAALAAKQKLPAWNDAAVREVAQGAKGPLFVATPFETRLDDAALELHRAAPPDVARLGFAVARELGADVPDVYHLDPGDAERAARIARALGDAEAPVVVSGTSLGEESLLDAAAAIVGALRGRGVRAKLFVDLPEANSLGVALLGGGSLDDAVAQTETRRVAALLILENDLFRRAPRALVEELLARADRVVVLDYLDHETAERADLFLPAGSVAESDGTFVNNEGRAQRFFQVVSPDDDVRESWRWLAGPAQLPEGDAPPLDAVLRALVEDYPELAGVESAAPPASFRLRGQRIPRESHRYSGRTAMHANEEIHEPRPPEDPDSPLAFSMEGYRGHPPPALLSEVWAPGWNSVQALNHYQREVGEALEGEEAGSLLFASASTPTAVRDGTPTERFQRREDALRLWPVYEIYGSEELSAIAPAVASRAPEPYVVLSAEDARRLELARGDEVELRIGGAAYRLRVRVMESLAAGVGGLPVGIGDLQGVALPAWGRVGRLR